MSFHHRTFDFVFTGALKGMIGLTDDVGGNSYFKGSNGTFLIEISNLVRLELVFDPNDHGGSGNRIPMHLILTWINGALSGATNQTDTTYPIDAPAGPVTVDLTGSYTVTIHDCWEEVDSTDGTSIATTNANLCDTLQADRALVDTVYVKQGQAITVTCTYGGSSVSQSCTAGSDFALLFATKADLLADANRVVGAYMEADLTIGGLAQTSPGGTYTSGPHSAQWGATVRAECTLSGNSTGVSYLLSGLLQYDWQCQINAIDVPYPDPLVAQVTIGYDTTAGAPITHNVNLASGFGSLFIEQVSYLVGVTVNGAGVYSDSLDNLWPVSAIITSASLVAAGEDPAVGLRPVFMGGWLWDAAALTQPTTLDAWTGSIAATGSGGTISVAANLFDARLLGTSWVGADLSGYGLADLSLVGDAAGLPARVHLGGKYWDVTVGTSGSVPIDLTSPDSAHAAVDTVNSIYPLVGSGPYSATEGWSTGVHNASSIMIDHLASGHTYTLTKLTLKRQNAPNLTFLDPFKAWETVTSATTGGVTSTTSYREWCCGDTDGAPSFSATDKALVHLSSGGGSDTIGDIAIKTFVVNANGAGGAYPTKGWGATDLQVNDHSGNVLHGLINSDLESVLLFGGGLYYDGTAYQTGIRVATGTLRAQYLFNSIVAWPGAGDIWGWSGGGTGTPVKLRARLVLRAGAWGLTQDGSGARQSGVLVTLQDHTSHAGDGSGTSDATGEFRTGTPFARGLTTVDASAGYTPVPVNAPSLSYGTRGRYRYCFHPVTQTTDIIWSLRDYTGRLMIWRANMSGALVCLVYDDHDASPVSYTVDSSGLCSWPAFHLQGVNLDGTYLNGTTAMWARSTDHARNWTMLTIPGAYPYTALTSAEQRNRLVVCGFHQNNPAVSGDPATDWYCQVGKLNGDGSYTWSATPVAMGLSNPTGKGHLRSRPDGVLEFGYIDTSDVVTIVRCFNLSLAGAGTWS